MSARRLPKPMRRVAALHCHACLAVFTEVDLSEGERFVCPKCLAGQQMDADDPWSLELAHGPSLARGDRSSLWRQDDGRIRTISGAAPASAKPPGAPPELPDPFSPPPALPPLGHETNPEPNDILRGLRIAGSVIAVFVLALALLLVTSEFERRRPPHLPPPTPTSEAIVEAP